MKSMGPNPRRKSTTKGSLLSTRISTEIDQEENEQGSKKKYEICRQHCHNRNNCPNISLS